MSGGGWGQRGASRSASAFKAIREGERERARERAREGADADRTRLPPRHCWVTDPPAAPGRWPGVVVGWRPAEGGRWQGRVVVVVGHGAGAGVLDVWLDENHLAPA